MTKNADNFPVYECYGLNAESAFLSEGRRYILQKDNNTTTIRNIQGQHHTVRNGDSSRETYSQRAEVLKPIYRATAELRRRLGLK